MFSFSFSFFFLKVKYRKKDKLDATVEIVPSEYAFVCLTNGSYTRKIIISYHLGLHLKNEYTQILRKFNGHPPPPPPLGIFIHYP